MPPRHAPPQVMPAMRAAASLQLRFIALCLLMAPGVDRIHAQSTPPAAVTTPADRFHQPCIAVRASPNAADAADVFAGPGTGEPTPTYGVLARKQYVDLDNRCATPPAFAPTRDIDSTSFWHVHAPASGMQATPPPSGASALHGALAS